MHKIYFLILVPFILSACASDKAIYRGQTLNGLPHGSGKKFFPDGSKYDGQWSNGVMSGTGTLTLADGRHYEGGFDGGKFGGQGKMKYPDGSTYEGGWSDGVRFGQGRMNFADQSLYNGGWQSDTLQGFGKHEFPNGNFYMGFHTVGERRGDGAALAFYYPDNKNWCINNCSQSSAQYAVVSGDFSSPYNLTVTPCGTEQAKCRNMVQPAYAAIGAERARKLAEAEKEKKRLAEEAERERKRKEAALLAEQKRKEAERLALLQTGTASQVYIHADKLENDKNYAEAAEAYRIVVERFPESGFAASAMTRLGVMRDKREQQEAEAKKAAQEAEYRRLDEELRQKEAAARQAEREAEAAQRQEAANQTARQQQKAPNGAACVEAAKALCDQTTSGLANLACNAAAGVGCN